MKTKEEKRKNALSAEEESKKRSAKEQIKRLDERLGCEVGAVKERKKLWKKIGK